MQLGMIGLGRMGGNIVRRLMRNGHTCVVYDTNAASVAQLATEGATPSSDMASFISQLQKPRIKRGITLALYIRAFITNRVLTRQLNAWKDEEN